MDIRPLEVPDEDSLKVHPVADAVVREVFEPRSNMFPHADGEVLNDEVIIIQSGVRLPGILGDVGRRTEALWERRSLDALTKGPWPQAI